MSPEILPKTYPAYDTKDQEAARKSAAKCSLASLS